MVQCSAKTQAGKRCSRSALSGSKVCAIHAKKRAPAKRVVSPAKRSSPKQVASSSRSSKSKVYVLTYINGGELSNVFVFSKWDAKLIKKAEELLQEMLDYGVDFVKLEEKQNKSRKYISDSYPVYDKMQALRDDFHQNIRKPPQWRSSWGVKGTELVITPVSIK